MPQIELKSVQRELESGKAWPFYWIYGAEKYKSREILKRIRNFVLGAESSSLLGWGEESFDGNDVSVEEVLDAVMSPVLGGGIKLIVVRDAHQLKGVEALSELLGSPKEKSELSSVCVCLAKDLDGRKKFSKILLEKAAVVPCDPVGESQKEAWIHYLAKCRGMELDPTLTMQLCALDPWTLDIVDLELEKVSLSDAQQQVVLKSDKADWRLGGADRFMEKFFCRDLSSALPLLSYFAEDPDEALPLLGLLGWNARQLTFFLSPGSPGGKTPKLNPYLADKLKRWSQKWKLEETIQLQEELVKIDHSLKQSPLLPLGVWSDLLFQFCQNR